jgi:uncharacterized alkaline shock family protein YloU
VQEPSESVHSVVVRADISHAVIATYVADAVRGVPGVTALTASRPVRVVNAPDDGSVDVDVRIVIAPSASCPDVSRAIDRAVRSYLGSMVAVLARRVSVTVEGVGDGVE